MSASRSSMVGSSVALCAAIVFLASGALGQAPAAISYTVDLKSPEQHLLQVQMLLPEGSALRDLQLPVWNALYQVRDFAQYVNWIRAKDRAGRALEVHELNKSCWRISGAAKGAVVEYEIFADTPGPFGAQLNAHHAFLNLAQILMYEVDARSAALTLRFTHVPAGWRIASTLQAGVDASVADSYDRVVDSPVEIGDFQEAGFEEAGGHYRVVVDAEAEDYNMEKIVADLRKIVAAATSWMQDRPFDSYMFIYHFPHGPAGGGMEHADSTSIDLSAETIKGSAAVLRGVTSHEFFHLWNVKRIRPQTLEPADYTKENYTRALWFSEGVTSTVEGTIQLRAGLQDEKSYLYHVSDAITDLERRPAHLTQSAEASSLDAWLEGDAYYRRPERSISYYNKGELLGITLDLAIREASRGRASLREMLQWMNVNYAKKGRFFQDSGGVREAAEAVAHSDLSWFFTKYVEGTEEIPWNDFFRTVGLRVVEVTTDVPDAGFIASRNFDGPMIVTAVSPGSEADRAGMKVGDSILEILGKPAGQESEQQLARLTAGDTVSVKLRTGRVGERQLKFKVGSRQEISYELKDLDQVSEAQHARRTAWLKGEAQSEDAAQGVANR
jgi:predicted metalloprotease with PDZ domain